MYDEYGAALFDLFGTLVDDRGDAIAGARGVLESLPRDRWAIVTSCGARFAQALVRRAALPEPPCIVSADDVSRGKPDPEPYLVAARRLDALPPACLVVEDSMQGVQSGLAAGMDVIAVRHGRATQFPVAANVVDAIGELRFEQKENGAIVVRGLRRGEGRPPSG
jgi:sugar-phosphatase